MSIRGLRAGVAALLAVACAGCDAAIDARAEAAVMRAKQAAALSEPGPADDMVARYAADIAAASLAYEEALAMSGFAEALGYDALTRSDLFAAAPERIALGKSLAARYRDETLARTDRAIAEVEDLKARPGMNAAAIEQLAAELRAARARRAAHWDHALRIMDETLEAWKTLDGADGDWAIQESELRFTEMRDKDRWDAHDGRLAALANRQDILIQEQARAHSTLRSLARQANVSPPA